MSWMVQAEVLLRKARQDAVVVEKAVSDLDISDEIVGFHAQQACEKAFKAVLAASGIAYPRTHNLVELQNLFQGASITIPADVIDLIAWSPFAVVFRYEDWISPDPVDRVRGDELVKATLQWADTFVTPSTSP